MSDLASTAVAVTIGRYGELECLGCGMALSLESPRFFEPISFEKHLLAHRRMGHSVNTELFKRAKRWRSNFVPESTLGGSE